MVSLTYPFQGILSLVPEPVILDPAGVYYLGVTMVA
jgi:hypothetical protein